MGVLLSLVSALGGFYVGAEVDQLVERSHRVVDAEMALARIEKENAKLVADLVEEQSAVRAAEAAADGVVDRSRILNLYGPGFRFYWQFDLKRDEGAAARYTNVTVHYSGETERDGQTHAIFVIDSAETLLGDIGGPLGIQTGGGRMGFGLVPLTITVPIRSGATRVICRAGVDLVLAIESADINSLRAGLAVRASRFQGEGYGEDRECAG